MFFADLYILCVHLRIYTVAIEERSVIPRCFLFGLAASDPAVQV